MENFGLFAIFLILLFTSVCCLIAFMELKKGGMSCAAVIVWCLMMIFALGAFVVGLDWLGKTFAPILDMLGSL